MIKNTKQIFTREPYEAPSCEVLRLQTEGIVCTSFKSNGIILDDAINDNWGEL